MESLQGKVDENVYRELEGLLTEWNEFVNVLLYHLTNTRYIYVSTKDVKTYLNRWKTYSPASLPKMAHEIEHQMEKDDTWSRVYGMFR